MDKKSKHTKGANQKEKMTRKEAIKKAGVTALATSSLILLNSKESSACSCPNHNYSHDWGENE